MLTILRLTTGGTPGKPHFALQHVGVSEKLFSELEILLKSEVFLGDFYNVGVALFVQFLSPTSFSLSAEQIVGTFTGIPNPK